MGALRSLSSALAAAAAESPQALQELLSPRDHKRLFVSLGAHWMFTYSTRMADRLHNVPLLLAFALPWALALLTPRKVRGMKKRMWMVDAHLCPCKFRQRRDDVVAPEFSHSCGRASTAQNRRCTA